MQPFDLGFYQQGPTLEPELFIQYNRMRLVERLDSDSLHALFDNYTTKSERKKRKKTEQTAGEKVAKNLHQRLNYEPGKRKKAYDESKTPKTTPNPTPANSPQKRPAPSQAGSPSKKTKPVDCRKCGANVEVDVKTGKKWWVCKGGCEIQRNCTECGAQIMVHPKRGRERWHCTGGCAK
jgi:hypothetical protein